MFHSSEQHKRSGLCEKYNESASGIAGCPMFNYHKADNWISILGNSLGVDVAVCILHKAIIQKYPVHKRFPIIQLLCNVAWFQYKDTALSEVQDATGICWFQREFVDSISVGHGRTSRMDLDRFVLSHCTMDHVWSYVDDLHAVNSLWVSLLRCSILRSSCCWSLAVSREC